MLVRFIIFGFVAVTLLAFQNCSKVAFSPDSANLDSKLDVEDPPIYEPPVEPPVICNPLAGEVCSVEIGAGLKGNLYFLTEAHKSLFSDDLGNAKLNDYYQVGNLVPNPVVMNQINISPRSWDAGFITGAGEVVQANETEKLFEWFALDLKGFIQLPEGEYQFAQLSDDGMRTTIDGVVVIDHDGLHSPSWKCSEIVVTQGSLKLPIRVEYFQGPRVDIAMQLFIRPADQIGGPCDATGGWQEIAASAFTH